MKRAIVIALLCLANLASAGPSAVLVLRSEGTADAASRTSIDTHVLRLARHLDGKVDAGDITLTEAAAAVGCSASEPTCKDEVLTTLGVDEVIATTVTATPTGFNITVRRVARSGTRAAQTTIASVTTPDAKLDTDIGPLFGYAPAPPAPAPTIAAASVEQAPSTEPTPTTPTTPASSATAAPAGATTAAPGPLDDPGHGAAPIDTNVTAAPTGAVVPLPAEGGKSRRLPKIGMGVGAGFVLLSFLMWSQANDVQGQIDDAPEPRTPADFAELADLEKRGDNLAGAGNLFFFTGAIVGGVSAYLYWRAGSSSSSSMHTARIAPAALPHGAGVTLTIGGAP